MIIVKRYCNGPHWYKLKNLGRVVRSTNPDLTAMATYGFCMQLTQD